MPPSAGPEYNRRAMPERLGQSLDERAGDQEQTLREQLDAARLRAREAERTSELLLTMMSHELRTPLHGLTLDVESSLLRIRGSADGVPSDWMASKLERMRRAVGRLTRLTQAFLDAAQVDSNRMPAALEDVDLSEVVRTAVQRSADDLSWARCECRTSARRPEIGRWDRRQMELIVDNLLSNAIKYGAGHPIDIEVIGEGDAVRLVVRDGGAGIAAEDLPRLFQRFVRLPSASRVAGFGLGLWMVKHCVDAHGGQVRVTSAPDAGATFEVTLPRDRR